MLYMRLKILYDYLMQRNDISNYDGLFFETANDHITSCESLLIDTPQTVDMQEIFRHIHSLKGSSQMMGFENISNICQKLISIIRPDESVITVDSDGLTTIKQLFNDLKKQL